MNKQHLESNSILNQQDRLVKKYALTQELKDKLERYATLLIEWNKKFNLTAITHPSDIYTAHFDDSLAISHHIDFNTINNICDVGTGAGFPAIPLKIMFPHLTVILIEVNNKKRTFLEYVIKEFALENVIIYPHDWRTFLRTTTYPIDYFFARASLQLDELVRIFRPTSFYKNTTLVYWASRQWTATKTEIPYLEKEVHYTTGTIQRKFIFFTKKNNPDKEAA